MEMPLLRIVGLRGVPQKLINLMSDLFSGTESAVTCGDSISDIFPVVNGVRQGCALAPTLFSTCTGFWRVCRRDQAAVHNLVMSRSQPLI